jgi:hypothetical protein
MKTLTVLTRVLFLLLLPLSLIKAQAGFEGVVESVNTTTDEMGATQRFTMTMWVKDGMVRISMSPFGSNPGTTILYHRDRGSTLMLNDQEKTYFEIRQASPGERTPEPRNKTSMKRTGKVRTILGYPCDQLVTRDGDAQSEFWATKKLGGLATAIAGALDEGGGEGGEAKDELAAMGYFPLVARIRLEGRIIESSEVTKLQKRKCENALFELPEGYKKQSMQDVMEGGVR